MSEQGKTVSLFDLVYFYKGKVDDENLKRQFLDILEAEKSSDRSVQISNKGGFQSDDLRKNKAAPDFLNGMKDHINNYLGNYKIHTGFRVDLSGLWVNGNQETHFNLPHNHLPNFFSGVWYLKVPENSGDICFLNPLAQNVYNYHHFFSDACFQDMTTYRCKEDDIIIFPAYITHFVFPNQSNEERVSVAFNFNLAP